VKKHVQLIESKGFANFVSMRRTIDLTLRTLQKKSIFRVKIKL
jgi:hypothetical protein